MTWSKSALPTLFTYLSRLSLSAVGDPVKRPVLIPPDDASAATVLARASPAASQAGSDVRARAHAHAADGFLAPLGITKDEPLATVNGLPSLSLNGTALIVMFACEGRSTFGYHCWLICAATWSLTYWFSLPKVSNVSMKLFTLAKPPWASVSCLRNVSDWTLALLSRVGLPLVSMIWPPLPRNQRPALPGTLGSRPRVDGLPPDSL